MRNHFKNSITDIALICLYIAVFRPYFLPNRVGQVVKFLLILFVYVYFITNVKIKSLFINMTIPFCVVIIISSVRAYASGSISFLDGPVDGIFYAMCIYAIYVMIAQYATKNKTDHLSSLLFKITGIYCILNFITLFHPVEYDQYGMAIYAFGSKFMACYFFLLFTSLFLANYDYQIKKKWRWKLVFLSLIVIDVMVGRFADCSTGVVACLVFIIYIIVPERMLGLLKKPVVICLLIVASVVIPFVFAEITKIGFVQYFIEDILGRNLNLTRRTVLYDNYLLPVIYRNPWWGYGYGNRAVFTFSGSYGNAQNGLLEHIVNYGIVGACTIIVLSFLTFKKSANTIKSLSAALLVVGLIVAGVIEVSYNWFFFLALSLVRWLDNPPSKKSTHSRFKLMGGRLLK